MDPESTSLLAKLFGNDGRTIPYRPEVAKVVGGICPAILLQQIVYRANGNRFEPFYKFKEPCGHHLYREGDSWTEELGFSKREFDNAIQDIAVKKTTKVSMDDALELARQERKPVIYWTNASRVTFYRIELTILVSVLSAAYDLNPENELSKITKTNLHLNPESDFIKSENTTIIPQKDPATPDPSLDGSQDTTDRTYWQAKGIITDPDLADLPIDAQIEITAARRLEDDSDDPPFYLEGETPTAPTERHSADDIKAGVGKAAAIFETNARNGNGRAGVADPTHDPWVDVTIRAWCSIAGKDFDRMTIGTKLKLADIFRKVGAIAESNATSVGDAIQSFPAAHEWWATEVGFEWPTDRFCDKLLMMLQPDAAPAPIDLDHPTGDRRPIIL